MRVRVIRQLFQLKFMIEKSRPDLLTLTKTFYDASVSRNLFSKAYESIIMRLLGTDGLIYKGHWTVIFFSPQPISWRNLCPHEFNKLLQGNLLPHYWVCI